LIEEQQLHGSNSGGSRRDASTVRAVA
jgi:hypothetical protein